VTGGQRGSFPGERPRQGPRRGTPESQWERKAAERRRRPKPRDPRVRSDDTFTVGEILAGLFGKKAFAEGVRLGNLARRWPEVVGERLAAECRPVRLEGGNLVVAASSGPWGAQVKFLAGEIRKGANRTLEGEPVTRVTVVVDDTIGQGPKPL